MTRAMTGTAGHVQRAARRTGALAALLATVAVFTLAGCNAPSVEDVCKLLDQQDCSNWSGMSECVVDGTNIQERVDQEGGCEGAYEIYRQCLWDARSCAWESECADSRAELESCIGEL